MKRIKKQKPPNHAHRGTATRHRGCNLTLSILIGCLFFANGCMSMKVMSKAKPPPKRVWQPEEQKSISVPVEQQPAYYILLPFSIAGDIATSPFQIIFSIMATTGEGGPL